MKTFTQYSKDETGRLHAYCVGRMRYPALTPGLNGRMEYTWSGWRNSREKAMEEAYCKAFGIDNAFQSVICQSRHAYTKEFRHAEEYRNSGPSLWSPGYRLHSSPFTSDVATGQERCHFCRVSVPHWALKIGGEYICSRCEANNPRCVLMLVDLVEPKAKSYHPSHGGYPANARPWRFGDGLPGLHPKPQRIEAKYVPLEPQKQPPPFDKHMLANLIIQTIADSGHFASFEFTFYGNHSMFAAACSTMRNAEASGAFGPYCRPTVSFDGHKISIRAQA